MKNIRSLSFIKDVQQLNGRILVFQLLKKNQEYVWEIDCERAFNSIKDYLGKAPLLTNPTIGKVLHMYIAFTNKVASTILVVDKEGR